MSHIPLVEFYPKFQFSLNIFIKLSAKTMSPFTATVPGTPRCHQIPRRKLLEGTSRADDPGSDQSESFSVILPSPLVTCWKIHSWKVLALNFFFFEKFMFMF